MGTGPSGQIGEELVDPQQMPLCPARCEAPLAFDRLPRPGWRLVAAGGHGLGTNLIEDVVPRIRATTSAQRPEPVHQPEPVQLEQPPLGEAQRPEQGCFETYLRCL
jgi:hypothetical protein